MNYSYICRKDPRHVHVVPGKLGQDVPPLTICPQCGNQAARKYTVPSVTYKGMGFTGAQKRRRT